MATMNESEQILLLKQDLENHKQQSDENIHLLKKQIRDLDLRVKEMEMSKQKTEYQYEQIMRSLEKLNDETIPNLTAQIEELKNKPIKRYDQTISGIIGAICGVIGTALANLVINNK